MSLALRVVSSYFGALILVGCGPTEVDEEPPVDEPEMEDAPSDPDEPATDGMQARLLVPMGGDAPALHVFELSDAGQLTEVDAELPISPGPRTVVVRADGGEAVVPTTSGGPGNPKELHFFDLTSDVPSLLSVVEIGNENSPTSVSYVGSDELLVTMRGPDPDYAVQLTRNGEIWDIGQQFEVGEGPLSLHAIDQDTVLLLRADFLGGTGGFVTTLRRAQEGWQVAGDEPILGTPIELAMHASGAVGYLPTAAPTEGPVLNPPGLLHMIAPGSPSWTELEPASPMPNSGSQVTISPDGQTLVVNDPIGELDEYGRPFIDYYQLQTFDLSEPIDPQPVSGDMAVVRCTMFDDLTLISSSRLVVSRHVDAGVELNVLDAETPGQWQPVGEPMVLPSSATAVVAVTAGSTAP